MECLGLIQVNTIRSMTVRSVVKNMESHRPSIKRNVITYFTTIAYRAIVTFGMTTLHALHVNRMWDMHVWMYGPLKQRP